ncbi:response regulator [Bdellovibrio bacteriovorus]|uniref:Response regulator n=1 Tax=Bdellovibrio bacteriovorus str. Tiberius TaxID=1069642 RepID=K7Z288_BDEBC|nr:response regulator [Bdellovibrio bacteriovorus]AFY03225.1 response regulator [Bdellovibrio bacteriovorus str. Tiberius]
MQPSHDEEHPLRILLVEDNDDHALIVMRNLKKESFVHKVDRVSDGVQALQYLRGLTPYQSREKPDIILLDLKLPRLDGHEVLSEVKDDAKLRKIPIIVLTTSDAEVDKLKAYDLHANSYLVKPLQAEDLKKMVESMATYWGIWNRNISKPEASPEKEH